MPRDGATIFGDLIGKFDVLPIEIANARRMGRYVRAPHTGIKDGHSSARLPPLALPGSARPPWGSPDTDLLVLHEVTGREDNVLNRPFLQWPRFCW